MEKNNAYYTELYGQQPWWVSGPAQEREQERHQEEQVAQEEADRAAMNPIERFINDVIDFLVHP